MGYAEQQRQPGKHLTGLAVVVIFHLLLGYALMKGLAREIVKIIRPDVETKIIDEVKKPPPPPEPPPPPKLVQIIPPFIPPPEVMVSAPSQMQSPFSITSNVAPPKFAPPAPAPQASAGPPVVGVVCPNSTEIRENIKYPPQARRDGLQGELLIEFTVAANGEVKDVDVKSSSNRIFNSVSVSAVRQFRCNAQGRDIRVQVPFSFRMID